MDNYAPAIHDNPDELDASIVASQPILTPVDISKIEIQDRESRNAVFSHFIDSWEHHLAKHRHLRPGLPPSRKLNSAVTELLNIAKRNGLEGAFEYFQKRFQLFHVQSNRGGNRSDHGFVTGYYEPIVPGSLHPTDKFSEPIVSLPKGHIRPEETWSLGFQGGIALYRDSIGTLRPCPERSTIESREREHHSEPIVWVEDAIEAFMIHVQGSARISLQDGKNVRIKYAGRNGHPYSSIGKILIETGQIRPEDISLETLKSWVKNAGLAQNQKGRQLLHQNKSYIYFEIDRNSADNLGPVGAAGCNLVPHVSIAIDRRVWPYGLLYFLEAHLPWNSDTLEPFNRLAIGHDTGSAIIGAARADIYFGSGPQSGLTAGNIRHDCNFYVFLPV